MWVNMAIVLLSTGIFFTEAPNLYKKGLKGDLVIFSLFLMVGTALSLAEFGQMDIPNPLDYIQAIYQPISKALQAFFS
ncbi:hypothetical protein [Thalassobacillus hwangdonensis]|uniref:Uncharacterized protein n=1 Tax=Thalassobacillus hwangdonensis TaxID=546108 RepID=A0ABW3KWL8_9BACI